MQIPKALAQAWLIVFLALALAVVLQMATNVHAAPASRFHNYLGLLKTQQDKDPSFSVSLFSTTGAEFSHGRLTWLDDDFVCQMTDATLLSGKREMCIPESAIGYVTTSAPLFAGSAQ